MMLLQNLKHIIQVTRLLLGLSDSCVKKRNARLCMAGYLVKLLERMEKTIATSPLRYFPIKYISSAVAATDSSLSFKSTSIRNSNSSLVPQ